MNPISLSKLAFDTFKTSSTDAVQTTHLCFLAHVCRANSSRDHYHALQASVVGQPKEWKNRRPGRATQMWLRTIERDNAPLNISLGSAYRHVQNWLSLKSLTQMAMSWTSPGRWDSFCLILCNLLISWQRSCPCGWRWRHIHALGDTYIVRALQSPLEQTTVLAVIPDW